MLVAVSLGLASCGPFPNGSSGEPPNVLLVVVDTLRADALLKTREGVAVMPRVATLAAQSVFYPNAVSPSSWTRPAMASVLTSLDVAVHGVYFSVRKDGDHETTDVLPASLDTLATLLKDRGYRTFAVQTNGNLTDEMGFARGFSAYRFYLDAPATPITDAALEELAAAKSPFFAYVHYIDPHAPYAPPGRFRDLFGKRPALSEADEKALADSMDYLKDRLYSAFGVQDKREFAAISPEGKEEMKVRYDAECRYVDEEIGRLLDYVDRNFPNTLIVFLSDHGEEFWEHGSMGHGTSLHGEQVDVPLIIHGPGLAPVTVPDRVSTLDVLPTVFGRLGLPPNPQWQGRDLFAPGRALSKEDLFAATRGADARLKIDAEMVSAGKWKLIRDANTGNEQLFDTDADRDEQHDRAADDANVARELAQTLESRQKVDREHPLKSRANAAPLDAESLEKIKAIGYGANIK